MATSHPSRTKHSKHSKHSKRSKRSTPSLVSAEWLRAHLSDPDLRVIDLRWYLKGRSGREEYERGHIPGAVFIDLDRELTPPAGPGRHPIPSPQQFAALMSRVGVGEQTRLVVYDDASGSIAARLWWLMAYFGHPHRTSVLDGGLPTWIAEGGSLSTELPVITPGAFEARSGGREVVDKHAVERLRQQKGVVLLDARAPDRYRGESEPVDARPGHIPGALSAPWAGNLRDGRFLSAKELRQRYRQLGIKPNTQVVAYCGSGVTACHDLLALDLAGHKPERVVLYEGSWSDWARDSLRPAAIGET
jgi:thiosulfate/3-mercaptopyruvate sulfurtransferase